MVYIGHTPGLHLNDLLGRLGLPGGQFGAGVDVLTGSPIGVLRNLQDAYTEAALGRGTTGFERMFGAALPPFGAMPPPGMMLPIMGPIAGGGYHGGFQRLSLGEGAEGRRFERFLKNNPSAQAAFESAIGGRIVSFGRTDGKITVERFAPGFSPIPGFAGNPMANTAVGSLYGMEQSVLQQAGKLAMISGGVGAGVGALGGLAMGAMFGHPFLGLVTGGLGGLLSGLGGGFGGGMIPPFGGGFGFGGLAGPLGGGGFGSWNPLAMPGRINNTNPAYEHAHQAQVASVLHDPSLTVEDKVTLMIMLIMKKMDDDIERQANYINSIQQQQSNRQKKGNTLGKVGTIAGGALGGPVGAKLGGGVGGKLGGGGNSPSIDVETMKLKRMIDKRSQMFDMLRQIIDKYNETAKGIIQSIGR